MARPETFYPDLVGAWCADSVIDADEDEDLDDLEDLSGEGRHLVTSGLVFAEGASPWPVGLPIAVTDGGTQFADALLEAPWACLHDGSGGSFAWIGRVTGLNAEGSYQILFDTGVLNTGLIGAALVVDSDRQRIGVLWANGLSNGFIPCVSTPIWGPDGSFTINDLHAVEYTFSEDAGVFVYVDSELAFSFHVDDRTKGPAAGYGDVDTLFPGLGEGPPAFALRLFSLSAGIQLLIGETHYALVSSSIPSAEVRAAFDSYAEECGVRLKTTPRVILVVDGNSLQDTMWKEPLYPSPIQYMLLVYPKTRQKVRPVMRAIAGLSTAQMQARLVKHVLSAFDPDAPLNILIVHELVNSIANGNFPAVPPAQDEKENAAAALWAYCDAVREAADYVKIAVKPHGPHIFATEEQHDFFVDDYETNWALHSDVRMTNNDHPILGSYAAMLEDFGTVEVPGPRLVRYDGVHLSTYGNELDAPANLAAVNHFMRGRVIMA